jgi:hypothetical protein
VALFDLVDGPFRVVGSDRNITTVDDRSPAVEWVGGERYVVASTVERVEISYCTYFGGEMITNLLQVETTTALPDTLRSETRTRSVAGAGIMGSSEESNIVLDLIGGQARSILETTKGRDSGKDRISLQLSTKLVSTPKSPTLPEYHRHQEAGCTKDLDAVPQWESGRRDARGRSLRQQWRRQQRDTS